MKKTRNRILVSILLIMLILSAISSIGTFIRDGGDYYLTPVVSVEFQRQVEFLRILYNYTPGEDSDAPNVVFIAVPELEGESFLIMLDEEPTAESVQFILDFTRIPYENAVITKN